MKSLIWGGLSVYLVGLTIAQSGTYNCLLRQHLGARGCVGLGVILALLAGGMMMFGSISVAKLSEKEKNG